MRKNNCKRVSYFSYIAEKNIVGSHDKHGLWRVGVAKSQLIHVRNWVHTLKSVEAANILSHAGKRSQWKPREEYRNVVVDKKNIDTVCSDNGIFRFLRGNTIIVWYSAWTGGAECDRRCAIYLVWGWLSLAVASIRAYWWPSANEHEAHWIDTAVRGSWFAGSGIVGCDIAQTVQF
jgi:hypothetical protein